MNFDITHKESYSRSELLLRSFFGIFYIIIPHIFLLFFLGLWGAILGFIAFWVILFTGSYPRSWFDYQVNLFRWNARLNASINNLADGYPAFGLSASHPDVIFDIPYNEKSDRVSVLVRTLFGFLYVYIPHGFCLFFRSLATMVLSFLAWWVVLFTGSYPKSWHSFNTGTLRWTFRVSAFMAYLNDTYPPFSGKP